MELKTFCNEMGFGIEAEKILFPVWDKLCEHAAPGVPEFMKHDFYEKYYPMTGGPDGMMERMDAVSKIAAENPCAAFYASLLHYALFQARPGVPVSNLPLSGKVFGENAGVLNLMVALSSLPLTGKTLERLGIPERYLRDIASWLGGTIQIYAAAHDGIPGHTLTQTPWLRWHMDGKLFRIGRLEYLFGGWPEWLPVVYRNRKDGKLAVLCRDQWAFDKDGFRVDPEKETPAFIARLKELDGKITGTPVTPEGFPVSGRKVTLDLRDWFPLCAAWDQIPSVHIPGGGGMSREAVKSSLLEAKQFFRKYFSTDVKAFVCGSWIFNPAWEKELPDSNLADFSRQVYKGPCFPPGGGPGLFFVYGRDDKDPRTLPCVSSLHKAFCRIYERGEPLRSGAMFILADDLKHYGTEYYRRMYRTE
ncbi:MAG: hypothetical protein BWY31_01854 [Lentisphaerae bacterium ADurb.Bin242]|nr:MAG: hypothetical protein BWY31_01854 [Lentisphaerae bacterium ADurb.Bin242]